MTELMSTVPRGIICEDEGLTVMQLRQALVHAGYEVAGEAMDGERACALARETEPDFILMDIKLLGMNGIDAARRIMEERPTAIIMLTAFGDDKLVDEAVKAGATAYLVKPIDSHQLIPAIKTALARFETLETVRKENESLKDSLETRKLVERAKGILMEHKNLTESEAYRQLQKASRDKCKPMKQTALEVIHAGEVLS
jgi:AmiR/NasT family two-component response regulator